MQYYREAAAYFLESILAAAYRWKKIFIHFIGILYDEPEQIVHWYQWQKLILYTFTIKIWRVWHTFSFPFTLVLFKGGGRCYAKSTFFFFSFVSCYDVIHSSKACLEFCFDSSMHAFVILGYLVAANEGCLNAWTHKALPQSTGFDQGSRHGASL